MSHTIVKIADVFGLKGQIKMAANPPQCIVEADHCIVYDGRVMQYVGIGWTDIREATPEDYETIPMVLTPHCSHCKFYEILKDKTMYCFDTHKRITARKRPCKHYSEDDDIIMKGGKK